MCNGTIMDKLISFSIPLMLSGILQLMFNAVDIVVVGRFSGSQALAAVGSTTALINVFTNLFIGISLGANVLAARYYAAGKTKEMSETVHTAIALALVSGVAMAVIGVVFARGALEIMGTPDDVIAKSTLYMRIYFCGMPFFMMYNYGAAILRAVGDTKRPLIFLIVSGVINAVLNLFGGKNASVVVLTIVIAVLTSVLTNFMSNNATAAMLSPICIAMALSLGISPIPWVIVIAACSNLAIATSYGTAVNMQILPAGYKFSDFVKIGGPLLIILIVVVTASSLAFLF